MQHLDDGILQAWIDGPRSGLGAAERDEIERHLSSCEACTRRLEELEALSGRVETLLAQPGPGDEPVPEYGAVLARAHRRRTTGRRRSPWAAAAWAASVALALGIGWIANGLYRGGRVAETAGAGKAQTIAKGVRTDTSPGAAVAGLAPAAAPAEASANATRAASGEPVPAAAASKPAVDRAKKARSDTGPALVRGRVTDEAGRPLPAARVVVSGTGVGAITGRDGSFELSLGRVPADSGAREVTLKANMLGYEEASRNLVMRGGEVASTDIRLAPQAVALQSVVVAGAPKPGAEPSAAVHEMVVPANADAWGSWRTVSRTVAEAEMGFALLTVPDLRVARIEVGTDAGTRLARVVQDLGGGDSLELVEARSTLRSGGPAVSAGRARATTRRGDISIVASAPLAADSLAKLLARVR